MTVSRDLFLSILALDSYNRGYNSGVSIAGSMLGSAEITSQSFNPQQREIGFYATAYTWNGETIISYRGTDNFGPDESDTAGACAP